VLQTTNYLQNDACTTGKGHNYTCAAAKLPAAAPNGGRPAPPTLPSSAAAAGAAAAAAAAACRLRRACRAMLAAPALDAAMAMSSSRHCSTKTCGTRPHTCTGRRVSCVYSLRTHLSCVMMSTLRKPLCVPRTLHVTLIVQVLPQNVSAHLHQHSGLTCTAPKKLPTLVLSSESAQLYRVTPCCCLNQRTCHPCPALL
jgi:hypothetical protein